MYAILAENARKVDEQQRQRSRPHGPQGTLSVAAGSRSPSHASGSRVPFPQTWKRASDSFKQLLSSASNAPGSSPGMSIVRGAERCLFPTPSFVMAADVDAAAPPRAAPSTVGSPPQRYDDAGKPPAAERPGRGGHAAFLGLPMDEDVAVADLMLDNFIARGNPSTVDEGLYFGTNELGLIVAPPPPLPTYVTDALTDTEEFFGGLMDLVADAVQDKAREKATSVKRSDMIQIAKFTAGHAVYMRSKGLESSVDVKKAAEMLVQDMAAAGALDKLAEAFVKLVGNAVTERLEKDEDMDVQAFDPRAETALLDLSTLLAPVPAPTHRSRDAYVKPTVTGPDSPATRAPVSDHEDPEDGEGEEEDGLGAMTLSRANNRLSGARRRLKTVRLWKDRTKLRGVLYEYRSLIRARAMCRQNPPPDVLEEWKIIVKHVWAKVCAEDLALPLGGRPLPSESDVLEAMTDERVDWEKDPTVAVVLERVVAHSDAACEGFLESAFPGFNKDLSLRGKSRKRKHS